jgi:hypothetical protein
MPIKKYKRIKSLRLGRGCDLALNRQVVHKLRQLGFSKFARMTFVVEDVLPNPESVGFFRAWTEVPTPIHQAWRRGDCVALRAVANRTHKCCSWLRVKGSTKTDAIDSYYHDMCGPTTSAHS